jgi:hypothetical protein
MQTVKKIRIPKKHSWTVDRLSCPAVTVNGCLTVTGEFVTEHIRGNGAVKALSIRAETITCREIEAESITADSMRAACVDAGEVTLRGGYTPRSELEEDDEASPEASPDATPDTALDAGIEDMKLSEARKLLEDPAFLRLRAMHKLEQNYNCLWLLKTRTEAPAKQERVGSHYGNMAALLDKMQSENENIA